MTAFVRWAKFNVVGAMGMVVQVGTLAAVNRWTGGRYLGYLGDSAVALELAVLHNFIWHTLYTWADRKGDGSLGQQLLRFHVSNGLLSLLGNLALMRLLVRGAHMPLVAANLIAIACCSVVNFCVANLWAFAATGTKSDKAASLENCLS